MKTYPFIKDMPLKHVFVCGSGLQLRVIEKLQYCTLVQEPDTELKKYIPDFYKPEDLKLKVMIPPNDFKTLTKA